MSSNALIFPMLAHIGWTTLLYGLLTVARAPTAWGIGCRADGTNPWSELEPRVSANLSNQFEWPLFFYIVCLLSQLQPQGVDPGQIWLAWIFVGGRIVHSIVHISTPGVRLRGLVFMINFLAVLGMWLHLVLADGGV